MASKKINRAKRQISDQTTKGGLLGLFIYFANNNNIDPTLIALVTPIISATLAWLSTKVGDPTLACIFMPAPDDDDNKK